MANPTLALVFGILGDIASLITFAAPLPTFVKIVQGRSVFEYGVSPYIASLLNQLIWLYYGFLLQSDRLFIIIISAIGIAVQLSYLAVYVRYADSAHRRRIILWVAIDVLIFSTIFLVTFFAFQTIERRQAIVGIFCVFITVISFAAPLSGLWQVVQTANVESMPIALSFALALNASMWLTYGIVVGDLFIMITNAVALALAGIQIILYGYFVFAHPVIRA